MAFGLTFKATEILCKRLAHKLNLNYVDVCKAFEEINREEIMRIAKNEKEGE